MIKVLVRDPHGVEKFIKQFKSYKEIVEYMLKIQKYITEEMYEVLIHNKKTLLEEYKGIKIFDKNIADHSAVVNIFEFEDHDVQYVMVILLDSIYGTFDQKVPETMMEHIAKL